MFGSGEYAPETSEDKKLLAHELTHVVQQSGSNRIRTGQSNEKSDLGSISRSAAGMIQKKDKPATKIPFLIHFDTSLTQEKFIQLANSQLNLDAKVVRWENVKEHYEAKDSPVRASVDASLVKKSRSDKAAADLGLGADDSGNIAGASKRADEFSQMPDREKQALNL